MARCVSIGCLVAWAALVTSLPGCGNTSSSSAGSAKSSTEAKTPSKTAALPKLGEYLPPLDMNRLEIAPPAGWQVPPRDSRWLAHFQEKTSSKYPAILVTAEDFGSNFTVTGKNVNEFAGKVAEAQDLSTVKPLEIGPFVGAMYRTRAKQKTGISMVVDRLFLETVVAGRKYVLELRTRDGSLAEYQPYLYAVAAGMKIGDSPEETAALLEPSSETKPAEAAPLPAAAGEAKAAPKPAPAEAKTDNQEQEQTADEKPKAPASEKPSKKKPEKPGIDLDKELKGLDSLLE